MYASLNGVYARVKKRDVRSIRIIPEKKIAKGRVNARNKT